MNTTNFTLWLSIGLLAGASTVVMRAAVLYLYADVDRATKGLIQTAAMILTAFAVARILQYLVFQK